jgi:hypothetical protein
MSDTPDPAIMEPVDQEPPGMDAGGCSEPQHKASSVEKWSNDPRVTTGIRFFVAILQTASAAMLIAILVKWDSMGDAIERLEMRLPLVENRVSAGEARADSYKEEMMKLLIQSKVQEELLRNTGWRLNRLERKAGIQ